MDVNDFVKLILAISGSISMLVISVQLGRFFGTLSDTLKKMQVAIENLNILTTKALEDYRYIRDAIESVGRTVNKIETYFIDPIAVAMSFVKEIFSNLPGMITGKEEEED